MALSDPFGEGIAIYIYIYAVELLSGPSLALLEVTIWSKFVFYKTPIVKKHYKNRGFSTFVLEKSARYKFGSYYLIQVGVFKDAPNLDQIITSNLDQIITSKNVIIFVNVCFLKNVLKCLFYSVFLKNNQKCAKIRPKKR